MKNKAKKISIVNLMLSLWWMLLSAVVLFYPTLAFSDSPMDDDEIPARGSDWEIDSLPSGIDLSAAERQKDHKIVAAGSIFNGKDDDFAVLRYNPDGSPDESFGLHGIVVTDFGGTQDRPSEIRVSP